MKRKPPRCSTLVTKIMMSGASARRSRKNATVRKDNESRRTRERRLKKLESAVIKNAKSRSVRTRSARRRS